MWLSLYVSETYDVAICKLSLRSRYPRVMIRCNIDMFKIFEGRQLQYFVRIDVVAIMSYVRARKIIMLE
jgi:hypothetical protein